VCVGALVVGLTGRSLLIFLNWFRRGSESNLSFLSLSI